MTMLLTHNRGISVAVGLRTLFNIFREMDASLTRRPDRRRKGKVFWSYGIMFG
jgi:hypothetical protein